MRILRDDDRPACRMCASPYVLRWGSARDRRRYRCRACNRTFSDPLAPPSGDSGNDGAAQGMPTGGAAPPLPTSRDVDVAWRSGLIASMLAPAPVRMTARSLGLPVRVVLHERQRVLRALERLPLQRIGGEVLLTVVPMPLGGYHSRVNRHAVWVAQNRTGARTVVALRTVLYRPDAEWLLRACVREGSTVVLRSHRRGTLPTAAERLGYSYLLDHDAEPQAEWQALRWAAFTYGRHLNDWLLQFRGVDVDALGGYVAWYEALQSVQGTSDPAGAWSALCNHALG